MKKKVSPVVYVTCGTVITIAMGAIKLVGWMINRAVVAFILH